MKTANKSKLRERNGYYYEFRPFYDALPANLEVPEYRTEIFPRAMTHAEIIREYAVVPYGNVQDAFAVIADCIPTLKNDYKGRLAYFSDTDGTLCRLNVWRHGDGMLSLFVRRVDLDYEWHAGSGVLASNERSDARKETGALALSPLDPLPPVPEDHQERVYVQELKKRGYRIYKTEEVTTEY